MSQGSPVKESEHESGALFPLSLYGLPKRKPSKTLLGSFFDFIEKQNDTVDASASDDDEEVEQQTLQRSTQGETTIPIYRNTDIEKKSSSISLNKGRKLEDIKDNLKELPVEEDSDGYNLAAHLEHLIEDLTSEESSTDEHNESTEDQVPQFDESVNHTTDHHNSNRGSEWLARKLFNPRLLGPNEKVFSRTRFKAMLRRIIPDQVTIPNSRLPHPPNHRPVKVYNCGTCHFLKLYIVFTLASCIFYFIFLDPCFRIKVFTTLNDTTIQPRPSHQMNVSKTLVNHVSPLKNYKGKGNRRTSRQKKHPKKRSFDDKPKIDAELKNCIFKKAYTVSMFFCLPVYLFIFIVYSCHFVIRYYDFAWFLLEAVFLLISSLFLTILAGFAFKYASDHLFVNIIGKFVLSIHFVAT